MDEGLFKTTIGEGLTDRYGKFSLNGPQVSSYPAGTPLKLKVVEEVIGAKDIFSHQSLTTRAEDEIDFIAPESEGEVLVTARLYEYQKDFPNLEQPNNGEKYPQQWDLGYLSEIARAGLLEAPQNLITTLAKSLEEVEKIYGVYNPELELSSATTVDLLLNGLFPCNFLKTDEAGFTHLVHMDWNRYELRTGDRPAIPNVQIYLTLENNQLTVGRVDFQFKAGGAWESVLETDPEFKRALYIANSMAIIKGEIHSHLGLGHLYVGQAAMAIFRAVRLNPSGQLLKPHLRDVLVINHLGATAIFGESGILAETGLSAKGIQEAINDVLNSTCYTGFKPREPINEDHRFAKAENLFWDMVSKVVDQFFAENEAAIEANWCEIYYMSKALVENSLPYRPLNGEAFENWWDTNEIDNPNLPGRLEFEGQLRAIRPITTSLDAPAVGDLENLKQFVRHVLFTTVFWHFAVHGTQGKWGTNLKIAALAPREPVILPDGGVKVEDASKQLSFAHLFMNFSGGELIKNKYDDIYPPFVELVKQNIGVFRDLGYDLTKMPFGTMI